MKRNLRNIGMTVVTVLATLLAIFVAPAPAQAAAAPTTSPAPASRYFTTNIDSLGCAPGYVCAVVPYGDGVYAFDFYTYGTYYLSNWFGTGFIVNYQTDGAAARLLNGSGGQIQCIAPPPTQWTTTVNWDPVYRIQLTASGC